MKLLERKSRVFFALFPVFCFFTLLLPHGWSQLPPATATCFSSVALSRNMNVNQTSYFLHLSLRLTYLHDCHPSLFRSSPVPIQISPLFLFGDRMCRLSLFFISSSGLWPVPIQNRLWNEKSFRHLMGFQGQWIGSAEGLSVHE